MKRMIVGAAAVFATAMALITTNASANPPDHAKGKAVGLNPTYTSGVTGSTGNGANDSGVYDPFGVCLPSGNGNHDAKADAAGVSGPTGISGATGVPGEPCAGSVGNADSKNPPGQLPGPQDANNGYECDGNSGIARGNPAHSFCMPTAEKLERTSSEVMDKGLNRLALTGGDIMLLAGLGSAALASGAIFTLTGRRK